MRIVRHASRFPAELRGGCVALGNFDGVHLGHQRVIGAARAIARDLGVPLGVMTFEPHPRRFFDPDQAPFALTPFRLKAHLIEALGADFLFVQHFDQAMATGSPDWFVRDVLVKALGVTHVTVGQDYAFGSKRSGDVSTLQNLGLELGFGVSAVAPVFDNDGMIVSSTRIRKALEVGDVDQANTLLGHPWEIDGRVEHGDARGRELGARTANIRLGDMQAPAFGVYAISAGVDQGTETRFFPGVANFGCRPTFGDNEPLLEPHLFDFEGDLYGKNLRVRFHHFLRPERSFPTPDALRDQILLDIATAKRLLAESL